MPFFKSFAAESEIGDVYRFEPRIWKHFGEFSRELMRGPSPLTPGERELIAGFVSGLNACEFCHGAHTAAAVAFGFPDDLMPKLLDDVDTAPVDDRLKPILRFVRKLTLTPAKMVPADADAVFAAGWDETALHHAIAVAARYSLVNRLIHGHGIEANPDTFRARGEHIACKTHDDWKADRSVIGR
jgi:uncharacterized peroxidase-related enzyme